MSLNKDPSPTLRTDEQIDQFLHLLGTYWKQRREMRFEAVVEELTPDYHWNPDGDIERRLTEAQP